jgi:hypothetical protein
MGYSKRDKRTGEEFWFQRIRGNTKRFELIKSCHPAKMQNEFKTISSVMPKLQKVVVSEKAYNEILYDFIPRWKKAKSKEGRFKIDHDRMVKRALTGFLGEACMEELLGVPVLDRDSSGRILVGESYTFRKADLSSTGLDVGIKTVEWGKFPVIKRNVKRAQVINFMIGERTFLAGGYASMPILRHYQKSDFILNKNLRNKRLNNGQLEKIAFWGLHQLVPITDLESLRTVYYKK